MNGFTAKWEILASVVKERKKYIAQLFKINELVIIWRLLVNIENTRSTGKLWVFVQIFLAHPKKYCHKERTQI